MISEIEITGRMNLPCSERPGQKKPGCSLEGAFESLLMAAQLLSLQSDQGRVAPSVLHDIPPVQNVRVDSLLEGPVVENLPVFPGDVAPETALGPEFGFTFELEQSMGTDAPQNESELLVYETDMAVEIPGWRGNLPYLQVACAASSGSEGQSENAIGLEALPEAGLSEGQSSVPELPAVKIATPADADLGAMSYAADDDGPELARTAASTDEAPSIGEVAGDELPRIDAEAALDDPEDASLEPASEDISRPVQVSLAEPPNEVGPNATDSPHEPVLDLSKPRETAQSLYRESLKKLPRSVELRLDPPELGKVTVVLTARGEEVAVRFVVESQEARRALAEAASDLSLALQEQGLVLTGAVVDNGSRETSPHAWEKRPARHGGPRIGGVRVVPDVSETFGFTRRSESALDYLA